ncbi:hypothetical protein ACFL1O_00750 [Patescibacteria group bacterium]
MTKQRIQDIIIKNKKNFNQDYLKKVASKHQTTKQQKFGTKKTSKGKIVFGILILLLMLVLSAKILNVFSQAVIKLKLHSEELNVDTIIKSGKNDSADLSFETIELQFAQKKSTKATGIKNVSTKASGQIVIYNTYSSQSQVLITTTRFETPDGKIYRINERVVVPGNGSVEATVYADKPGEEYNIDFADFTIPGFKDGPRYEKFYARSKTPMTGGFEGEMSVVSDEDSVNLKKELENNIRTELMTKANLQKPEGFLLYPDAIEITFSQNTIEEKPEIFTLNETGTLFAFLIPEKSLSKILVKKYLNEDLQNKVIVQNLENLEFELISKDLEKELVIFKLKGTAKFVWVIEEEKLKEALVASPKNLKQVFESYTAIEQASVVYRPSWWHFFPNKTSRIKIEQTVK